MTTPKLTLIKKSSERVKVNGIGWVYHSQEMQEYLDRITYLVAPESCGSKAYIRGDSVVIVGARKDSDKDTLKIILEMFFVNRYPDVPEVLDETFDLSTLSNRGSFYFGFPYSFYWENYTGEPTFMIDNEVVFYYSPRLNLVFTPVYEMILREKLYGEVIFAPARRFGVDGVMMIRHSLEPEKFHKIGTAVHQVNPIVFGAMKFILENKKDLKEVI